VATASAARRQADDARGDDVRTDDVRTGDAPDPIEHATPDVELAEAQLAIGRPQFSDAPGDEPDDDELEAEALDAAPAPGGAGGSGGGRRTRVGGGGGGGSGSGGELAPAAESRPSVGTATRLVNFLEGCWRELQRVQWPDRRQVMQATGVVIGFVIVAGVFLGVADLVASKVVTFILK
jgi:preprotein translocase subunit SecE